MNCDPFGNSKAIIEKWHNKERRKIHLTDGKSHPYVAEYDKGTFNAFVVDKGLLQEEENRKMCDVLLLKCPSTDNDKKSNKDGVAYFIEMKSQSNIPKAYQQLRESFERLNLEYKNWMSEYKTYYFRICYKSYTTNIMNSSHYRGLLRKIPKGVREEVAIKIDNFAVNPEKIK
jgi:hypothetical protein